MFMKTCDVCDDFFLQVLIVKSILYLTSCLSANVKVIIKLTQYFKKLHAEVFATMQSLIPLVSSFFRFHISQYDYI